MIVVSTPRAEYFRPIAVTMRTCDSAPTVNDRDYGPGELAGEVIAKAREAAFAARTYSSRPSAERLERFMRACLPYGVYVERDGSIVPHDRRYKPMWRVRLDGRREAVDRSAWITGVKEQLWFFNDSKPPWRSADMCRRARAVFECGDVEIFLDLVAEIQSGCTQRETWS
jgi:hypothetical protein